MRAVFVGMRLHAIRRSCAEMASGTSRVSPVGTPTLSGVSGAWIRQELRISVRSQDPAKEKSRIRQKTGNVLRNMGNLQTISVSSMEQAGTHGQGFLGNSLGPVTGALAGRGREHQNLRNCAISLRMLRRKVCGILAAQGGH